MNKINLLLLIVFISFISFSQQKKYVSYKIKSGENIRTIAKEIGISTRDLLKLNPDVNRNPALGTMIIIPNKNFGKEFSESESFGNTATIKYHVNQKDTMYGISKQFGITVEELLNTNPNLLSNGLKYGMTLLIPQKKVTEQPKTDENYVLHNVEKGNTLYNLSKMYGVSQEDLIQLNPDLKDGLKLGMQLKIKPLNLSQLKTDNEVVFNKNPIAVHAGFLNEHINHNKQLNVAVMLPYQLNKLNDSIKKNDFGKENSLLNIVTEFNLGANIAIDSLKQMGANIEVSYFDSENSNYKLQRIITSTNFSDFDVVIGPLFFENAIWLSEHKNVPVFAPFYSKKQLSVSKTNLIETAPDTNLLADYLFAYLKQKYNGEQVVLISDNLPESESKLTNAFRKIKEFYPSQNISVIKPENGYINSELIASKLRQNKENWVILISDENVTAATAVNNLKMLVDRFKITLIALNKGSDFDTIENVYLAQLNFLFPTTDFLNETDTNVQKFLNKYNAKNNTYPSKYAIRGFDVTYDSLIRLLSYDDLDEGLEAGKSIRNASCFKYIKTGDGSYENEGIFLIQYDKNLNTILLN